ncbi:MULTISPECIES: hypothetical protein [unclassified Pseudoalteromonas]|uniref:hypothetical protein n=1 Tax=unclassified Pseudoalteromonas TaxID=194690 RepID=UPI00257985B4|nr:MULTISPECIES: hypothetical protein [unclassified Pseudoalteromonas]|tara:strand:- start:18653 stop:19861 length:1209 start_codon:yes stop_codon:yes gene_type:complete
MKILIINYHFPPSSTAHSYRWSQLAKRFSDLGHDVDIIAGGDSGTLGQKLNIKRVNFPMTTRFQTYSNTSGLNNTKFKSRLSVFGRFKKRTILIAKSIYRSIFWPDGLWHWLPMAIFEVYKRRKVEYDLVIGYSPTYSALLAAKYYKYLNSNTTLIVDFGDPFSISKEMPVNNYTIYNGINRKSEEKIFQVADLITLTNEQTAKLYQAKYPHIDKFKVVPHLVDVNAFYCEKVNVHSQIEIGYIGALHKGIREPYLALEVLSKLERYGFDFYSNFYGPLNGIEFIESERVRHLGVIERDKAILLTKKFDIIINIENEACPMTPSKINECIASGKPILNFLSKTKTSSFRDYPLVMNILPSTCVAEISEFISCNAKKRVERSVVESCLKGKTLSSVADIYLNK